MRLAKYLVLAALGLAVTAADAEACFRRCRSTVVCYTPVCHCPHYPAGTLIIHVPADATVTVGGALLHQTGEVRIDHVPLGWTPNTISVCVEVKATYTVPPDTTPAVKTVTACFTHPGQVVHVDLRPAGKEKASTAGAGADPLVLADR